MSFNAVRRGPMGGDQYTQIHNGVFRDQRLTPNAVCVFGYLSTHAQGWETSVAGIARARGLGESLVKNALNLLKKHHYLVYGQERNPDGTKGKGWYFITDLPAQLAHMGIADDASVAQSVAGALDAWIKANRTSEPEGLWSAGGPTSTNGRSDATSRRLRSVSGTG